jgi:hypothetical protein
VNTVLLAGPLPGVEPGYGVERADLEKLAAKGVPCIDFHVHLRGGMTVEKAVARQDATGIRIGVLRNIAKGWPIETDAAATVGSAGRCGRRRRLS